MLLNSRVLGSSLVQIIPLEAGRRPVQQSHAHRQWNIALNADLTLAASSNQTFFHHIFVDRKQLLAKIHAL